MKNEWTTTNGSSAAIVTNEKVLAVWRNGAAASETQGYTLFSITGPSSLSIIEDYKYYSDTKHFLTKILSRISYNFTFPQSQHDRWNVIENDVQYDGSRPVHDDSQNEGGTCQQNGVRQTSYLVAHLININLILNFHKKKYNFYGRRQIKNHRENNIDKERQLLSLVLPLGIFIVPCSSITDFYCPLFFH